jgi:hypothetical protein
MLKCEQITTLPRDNLDVEPLGGALAGGKLREIELGVMRAIGIPVY